LPGQYDIFAQLVEELDEPEELEVLGISELLPELELLKVTVSPLHWKSETPVASNTEPQGWGQTLLKSFPYVKQISVDTDVEPPARLHPLPSPYLFQPSGQQSVFPP